MKPSLDDMNTFGFNSGRLYSSFKQRISVCWCGKTPDELEMWFKDHDRMIEGKLDNEFIQANSWYRTFFRSGDDPIVRAKRIMQAYDGNYYKLDPDGIATWLNAGYWPEYKI